MACPTAVYPPILRWVDAWCARHGASWCPARAAATLRDALAGIDDPAVRTPLIALGAAAAASTPPDLAPLLAPLVAYASALETRGDLAEAARVYDLVVTRADEFTAWRLLTDAHLGAGQCQLALGALETAETAYRAAELLATRFEYPPARLQAQLGLAFVADRRGDLARADALCCAIVTEAVTPALRAVQSTTLLHLAIVRYQRGQWLAALGLAYMGFPLLRDPTQRDWGLLTIGALMLALERWTAAAHTFHHLLDGPRAPAIQSRARVGLVALAARHGTTDDLAAALATVEATPLEPVDAADAYVEAARGYLRMGDRSGATTCLETAAQTIHAHHLALSVHTLATLQADPDGGVPRPSAVHAALEPPVILAIIEARLRTLPLACSGA